MKSRWNRTVLAVVLGGGLVLAPLAVAAPQQPTTEPREAPPGTRRDIRQDTRQLQRQHRNIRRDQRQLQVARARYGNGSPQARAVRRDLHHDKRSAKTLRRDRNRDVRIHQRRVARR